MQIAKRFGLVAAVVATMAFIAATPASANGSTTLCEKHEEPCPFGYRPLFINLNATSSPLFEIKVLGVTIGITCTFSGATGVVLELGKPQVIHLAELNWKFCKRESNGAECTVTTNNPSNLGLIDVLKTALNLGTAQVLSISVTIACTGLPTCTYGGNPALTVEGAGHTASSGWGMLTANKATLSVEGGGLCPSTGQWTALYEPMSPTYLVS